MVAAAVVGSAVVGGVASSVASSKASKRAGQAQEQAAETGAEAQLEAARIADETQRYMYDTSRQDYLAQIARNNQLVDLQIAQNQPFLQAGTTGINRLQYLLGVTGKPDFQNQAANAEVQRIVRDEGLNQEQATARVAQGWNAQYDPAYGSLTRNFQTSDFWADPVTQLGFQFGLDEGTKAINRGAAANGGLDSGATLKALTRYATDYTGTKANESFNRYLTQNTNTSNRLASLAGIGQTASGANSGAYNANTSANTSAVGGIASAGQGAANNISQNALYSGNAAANAAAATGNARAASAIAGGNAISSGIGQGVNALSNYFMYGNNSPYMMNNPYGNYQAQTSPVQDYYAGVNGTPIA